MTRRAILRVSPNFLLPFGIAGTYETVVTKNPLPRDVRVIDVQRDFKTGDMLFLLESSEFSQVHEGCPCPDLPPVEMKCFGPSPEKVAWLSENQK